MERRNRRKPQPKGVAGLLARLKASPIVYHAVLIALTVVVILVVSSILMNVVTRHGTHRTVPDFTGVRIGDAVRQADKERLEIIINDSLFVPAYEGGIVLDQLPKGGVEVKAGRKVYVTINSVRQKMVQVPYVAGRSLRQAKNMLEVAGLGIERLVYEEDIATNYVLAELVDGRELTPDSKIEIEMGSGVVLKVGVEPEKNSVIVPKTIGQGLEAAKSRLWEQGLNVGKINLDEGINLMNQKDARVYRQSLHHNSGASLGDAVDLWLTLDGKKVDSNSATSDKRAQELEEERLEAESHLRDSLEQAETAGRVDILRALMGGERSEEVTTTEEDEFF